jgi:DNA adenine methylase
MRYMGSKARIAKDILPIILKDRQPGQWYVEPFCGGCNTLDKVANPRVGNDVHYELMCYFAALTVGWVPPKYVNEDDYKVIKKGTDHKLKGYVGFSMSFGGKYFGSQSRHVAGIKGGYSSLEIDNRNGYRNALKQQKLLKGVSFFNLDYKDLHIPRGSIVYCDPPYAGTTNYSKGKFNHNQFYDWCRLQKARGCFVFVSEYAMPSDFKCVWEKKVVMVMNQKKGSTPTVEKLFTL